MFSNLTVNRSGSRYLFDANASHIGYRDQKYNASYLGPKVTFGFQWVSLPLNFSYITRTPFTTNGTTLTLDDNIQRAVQGPTNATNDGTLVGVPCAPGAPPAACSNPAQAAEAKATPSGYNPVANTFDLRHRRDTASSGDVCGDPERGHRCRLYDSEAGRRQPWGASFAFNDAVEVPLPIDQRTNDVRLGASWSNTKSMFRIGWDESWFNNAFESLVWDNPIRLTDFNNGLAPPNGPYDPVATATATARHKDAWRSLRTTI